MGGTAGQPVPTGTDVSNLFTLSGTFLSAPATFAFVVNNPLGQGQAVQITFTPVRITRLAGAWPASPAGGANGSGPDGRRDTLRGRPT